MRFKFKAVKSNGERYEGTLESESKFSLYNELKLEGDTLVSAEEINKDKIQKYFSKFWRASLRWTKS